jgi:hypothetical protein
MKNYYDLIALLKRAARRLLPEPARPAGRVHDFFFRRQQKLASKKTFSVPPYCRATTRHDTPTSFFFPVGSTISPETRVITSTTTTP